LAKNKCKYCGLDCKTKLALGKHEAVCEKRPEFYDWHSKKEEKCPICRGITRFFWKREWDLWVCLECGCVFVPKSRVREIEQIRCGD